MTAPGRPVDSGFTMLSPEDQALAKAAWSEPQSRVIALQEEADFCRARAAVAARSAFIR
jgi:archaeosine-15-forming tRNA-guanine transglycosylase